MMNLNASEPLIEDELILAAEAIFLQLDAEESILITAATDTPAPSE